MKTEYSQYYIEYAKSNNQSPDDMMALDEKRWPGGCMTGYILFRMRKVEDKLKEVRAHHHEQSKLFLSTGDQEGGMYHAERAAFATIPE